MLRSLVIAPALLLGCSGQSGPAIDPPAAPAANDPAFGVTRIMPWYLVGDALTPGQDVLDIEVAPPSGTSSIDLWLDDGPGQRLTKLGSSFGAQLDIASLPAGEHEVLLAADGSDEAFARLTFNRSSALYVIVSTDWDDPDNTDQSLELQAELHDLHPELLITHFVGPYTFTDPDMTTERMAELVTWVTGMRDTYGDEIGLHIHPYCSFVESAGLTCRTEPSTVYNGGDSTGYTVMCAAYSQEEFTTLLEHADELFVANGLGKPTSFRAGGWTANLDVLRAMADTGYVADTSANNWQRMEEWKDQANGVLYQWNQDNWTSIGDTSQPYYPSNEDILITGERIVPVLQVPDNGILVDYVTETEMIEIFESNWDGTALTAPLAYSIGWHPTNFNAEYQRRMDRTMDHLDQFLASQHAGPVVYQTLSNMAKVWPVPQ